jgi:hypothetical protein
VEEHPRDVFRPRTASSGCGFSITTPLITGVLRPSAFQLSGPLNVSWLEAAFGAVIQQRDVLQFLDERASCVADSSAFQLQQINLDEIAARLTCNAEKAFAETCHPFDLAAGPPFRAVLVRLQPTEHVLLLVLHHIISDGWSRSNFTASFPQRKALAVGDRFRSAGARTICRLFRWRRTGWRVAR